MQLLFKHLSPSATTPRRAKEDDAGYDLFADLGFGEEVKLFPQNRILVKTNVAACPPEGSYIRVAPRSGLAVKHGIMTLAGVVDRGYRDGIGVLLYNSGTAAVVFKHGDAIAQAVVEQLAPIVEVKSIPYGSHEELPASDRGKDGFGSTGR